MRWIVAGFLVPLATCVVPTLFQPDAGQLLYGVPAGNQLGADLHGTLGHTRDWLAGRSRVAGSNPYPPLAKLFFVPFAVMTPTAAYVLTSVLTLFAFVVVAAWYPRRVVARPSWSISSVLCVTTGLASFGLRFELERGQFNVVTMAIALAAVALFHRAPRYRWAAYLLLSAAVQLKLYPAIFAVAMFDPDEDPRRVGVRLVGLGAANLLLLGALGLEQLRIFAEGLGTLIATFEISQFNQSLHAFAFGNVDRLRRFGLSLPAAHPSLLVGVLVAVLGVCLVDRLVAARARARGEVPIDLVLACTIVALVLPASSYNYRLPMLVGPFAAFLRRVEGGDGRRRVSPVVGVLLAGVVAFYALTLVPPSLRPAMENALPLLLGILLGTTLLAHVTRAT